MALTKCRECGGQVSTDAKACPHCGASTRSPGKLGRGCAGFLVIGILITIAVALGNRSDDTESTNPSCKTDWTKCIDNAEIANKYSRWFNAQFRCKQEAIKQARYGTLEFPSLYFFSTFYKGNSYITSGTAILIEPDAQFQNGFGAMAHSQVICTYDLRGERVVSVDILLK